MTSIHKSIWKRYLITFLLSAILYLLVAPLAGGDVSIFGLSGFQLALIVGFIVFFIFTYVILYKYTTKASAWGLLIVILAVPILIETPIRIDDWDRTLVSLPVLIAKFLGIIAAYLGFRTKGYVLKGFSFLIPFGLFIWMAVSGYDLWNHKLNFGSFDGKVDSYEQVDLILQQDSGESISLTDFEGHYLILDFWHSYCKVCFREFPEVQRLYEVSSENQKFVIRSVHCRIESKEETVATGNERVSQLGYSFPVLSINITDPALSALKVNVFPTVLIFNPTGDLVFRGSIEQAERYLGKMNL